MRAQVRHHTQDAWFAIENALGRLQGGASCSLQLCLRECVVPAQQQPERMIGRCVQRGAGLVSGRPPGWT